MEMQDEYVKYEELEVEEKGSWRDKIGRFLDNKYFVPVVIILVAIIGFALGRVSGLGERREPVRVLNNAPLTPLLQQEGGTGKNQTLDVGQAAAVGASNIGGGSVVASKSGTKYHYPWCAGAKQISEKNKITFDSIEAARAAGYTPASNCKGLK